MGSPKFDSFYIEQELRNSRRIVELSKKYSGVESFSCDRLADLLDKLRNEEYLKNSYEKALKESMLLLKEEQKKNLENEKKIASLEAMLSNQNNSKVEILAQKLEDIEKSLIEKPQEFNVYNQAFKHKVSIPNSPSKTFQFENLESQRIDLLQERLLALEKLIGSIHKPKTKKRLKICKSSSSNIKKNSIGSKRQNHYPK
ncbi:hypothetical protein SteCoe_4757 [Stentor coeruleus]|uniref:Uncharacterized protein n=1 Tax=Stentor coeruleus TaxID=5963 RepID=A0A1R2CU24_9CILI|nr:hypothetical protein SteCoe_4757 [Stentor coeruleus]